MNTISSLMFTLILLSMSTIVTSFIPPMTRAICVYSSSSSSFSPPPISFSPRSTTFSYLTAKKKKGKGNKKSKRGGKGGGGATTGPLGFGSSSSPSSVAASFPQSFDGQNDVIIDRSSDALDFYSYLERNSAGTSLKRVALAYFPFTNNDSDDITGGGEVENDGTQQQQEKEVVVDQKDGKEEKEKKENDKDNTKNMLRGVVATCDIKKGENIIDIPFECAWNLGLESSDPSIPGITVLKKYCQWRSSLTPISKDDKVIEITAATKMTPYLRMLPPFGSDELGSTDFFSVEALGSLQSLRIKEETEKRCERTVKRYGSDVRYAIDTDSNAFRWDRPAVEDDLVESEKERVAEYATAEHLKWATWLVTSRVLTVQGDATTSDSYRLMIPLIDMCNHDRNSPHILTGRAVPGGSLKVVAGKNVKAGEQVNICYGGGVAGNDRFVQDYGFLDVGNDDEAYNMVAKILTGRGRIAEDGSGGAGSGVMRAPRLMPVDERAKEIEALGETTIEEDEKVLATISSDDLKTALEYLVSGGTISEGDSAKEELLALMKKVTMLDAKVAIEYRLGVKRALKRMGIIIEERKKNDDEDDNDDVIDFKIV